MLTSAQKIQVGDIILHPNVYTTSGLVHDQAKWAVEVISIEMMQEDGEDMFEVTYREVNDPSEGYYLMVGTDEKIEVLTQ